MPELFLPTIMFLVFVVTQRLGEYYISRLNTKSLRLKGGVEFGHEHYPYLASLNFLWVFGLVLAGHIEPVNYHWLAVFATLQLFRFWILVNLGDRWSTRIIVTDEPLVATGPFKYVRHPYYILISAEIFVAPMVLGLWQMALVFSLLNAGMLYVRIRSEEKALAHLR